MARAIAVRRGASSRTARFSSARKKLLNTAFHYTFAPVDLPRLRLAAEGGLTAAPTSVIFIAVML